MKGIYRRCHKTWVWKDTGCDAQSYRRWGPGISIIGNWNIWALTKQPKAVCRQSLRIRRKEKSPKQSRWENTFYKCVSWHHRSMFVFHYCLDVRWSIWQIAWTRARRDEWVQKNNLMQKISWCLQVSYLLLNLVQRFVMCWSVQMECLRNGHDQVKMMHVMYTNTIHVHYVHARMSFRRCLVQWFVILWSGK